MQVGVSLSSFSILASVNRMSVAALCLSSLFFSIHALTTKLPDITRSDQVHGRQIHAYKGSHNFYDDLHKHVQMKQNFPPTVLHQLQECLHLGQLMIAMPRNGVSTTKINWFIWPARNEKFVWGSVGLVTLPFLFSSLGRDHKFVHLDSYISVYPLSNSVTHEGIWENSLRTVSGLKKTAFFEELLHWICTERVICCCFLSTSDYHNNKTQTDMHFVHPVPYISDLSLSGGANYKQIGEKSLRTLSGLKIGPFHSGRSPWSPRGQTSLPGNRWMIRATADWLSDIIVLFLHPLK